MLKTSSQGLLDSDALCVVVGYQCFGGPCCFYLQQGPLKSQYTTVTLHSVTAQKTST
jgi:hypothetical protein